MMKSQRILLTLYMTCALGLFTQGLAGQPSPPKNILYGAAYYHEYMPYERLDEDIRLMKEADRIEGASAEDAEEVIR